MPGKPIRLPLGKAAADKAERKKLAEKRAAKARKDRAELVKAFDPRNTLLGRLVGALRSNKDKDRKAFKPK